MPGDSEKAKHYIALLDTARVNGSWAEFPELVRKVNKHAPHRKTLVHTATAEHEIATKAITKIQRPPSNAASQSVPLTTLSSTLQSESDSNTEDVFQGKTCLLWSRWLGPDGSAATAGFDTAAATKIFEGQAVSTWTKICTIKSAYIEGTSYAQNGRPSEALRVFRAATSTIRSDQELVLSTPQLGYWAEQLLAQLALASKTPSGTADTTQLEAFEFWATIAAKTPENAASKFGNSAVHLSRLAVWKRYFRQLSAVLERSTATPNVAGSSLLTQQAKELRKVERAYENELLRSVKFPTATESNALIEEWVEQVIRNWYILCSPLWRDAVTSEGGYDVIGRNVLDVLYRAAAKTFHSNLILRRLFQVHLSLSEFDLAYRAFDKYIELVERGRERVAKSGKPEPGHETDEVVLSTVSEAISGLCKYGRQTDARKAYELCLKVEDWLANMGIEDGQYIDAEVTPNGHLNGTSQTPELHPKLLQVIYRAIGTGKAQWARWTPASERRSDLQEEALTDLRKACSQGEADIETLYTTGLLLAETRDISGAIRTTKQALARNTSTTSHSSGWATERKSISLWHLLALLLSSRQDFDSASKSCVAAFEQFASNDLQIEPGQDAPASSSIEKQFNTAVSGLASDMGCDELQRIIEVRITELALTELVDGPEEAVNSSNELLSLFSRLFAHIQVPMETPSLARTSAPPKSSAGTVKSVRTSIFHRKKHDSQIEPINEKADSLSHATTNTTRPSTRATQAPTIQITHEDEKPSARKHRVRKSYDSTQSRTTDGGSRRLSHKLSLRSHGDTQNQTTSQSQATEQHQHAPLESVPDGNELPTPDVALEHEKSLENRQGLPNVEHNLNSHNSVPPPASHHEQPPEQDVRLPSVSGSMNATAPLPRYPEAVAKKQALTVLAKVWLIIATLYRRASMFEDSKEACEEASKAAVKIEALVSATDHSANALGEAGWGAETKSSDEVWADVYCERAELQLAIYNRKIKDGTTTDGEELRAAVEQYEQCLMFAPNHPIGVIGLSNVLLDFYERKITLSKGPGDSKLLTAEQPDIPRVVVSTTDSQPPATNGTTNIPTTNADSPTHPTPAHTKVEEDLRKTPQNLNRIAARDRAYGLLSTLTKLGSGWDDSTAWFALARAHELGGEIEKAQDILWWCVELEDSKPIRHWRNLGYSL